MIFVIFLVLNKSAGLIFRASAIFIIISKDSFAFPDSIPPIVPVPQLQIIESWAKDMDKTFKDLNAITKDAESGAVGYSFENCTLLKIEQPEKKTSGWEEVTFF